MNKYEMRKSQPSGVEMTKWNTANGGEGYKRYITTRNKLKELLQLATS